MALAITPINVGVSANDGTGDTNRAAWQKANTGFASTVAAVNTKAEVADLTTESAARAAADATLTTALAGKLNVTDFTDLATSPRFDGAQSIDNTERRQLCVNTGSYTTLMFPVVDPTTDPASNTFDLPFLPDAFDIVDMFVTLSKRTLGTGGSFQISYSLSNGGVTVGGLLTTAFDATGKLGSTIVISGHLMAAGVPNILTITITDTETGAPVHRGLALWLRGAWAQP